MSSKPSREELFALVWERPATEVAKELGISDVALGKLCRRLQVPKPPRGYWARVQAGQTPKRPPLVAFREEQQRRVGQRSRQNTAAGKSEIVRLSRLQNEYLSRALRELETVGIDTIGCQVTYDGIRALSDDLAAQIIILIQNRYVQWINKAESSAKSHTGAHQSIRSLVTKLLPLAKENALIFRRKTQDGVSDANGPSIVLRLSALLQQRVAQLYKVVRDYNLSYVASGLSAAEHAWSLRYVHSPSGGGSAVSELCVSDSEIWIRSKINTLWGVDDFETERFPIKTVAPVDLIKQTDLKIPAIIPRSSLKAYEKRLRALQDAEHVNDLISDAMYRLEAAVPDEYLALADRLWFSQSSDGPFASARNAWRLMEDDLEKWEEIIDFEKSKLCQAILGVQKGDNVLVESHGKVLRIQLEGASLYVTEKDINFHLWGKRYRKDGLPGKRQEYFFLQVENDRPHACRNK